MVIQQKPIGVNYTKGRKQKIRGVVIHTTVGSFLGSFNWFKNPSSNVSSHYLVKEDGTEVYQCVNDFDTTYTQGIKYNVTSALVKQLGGNPNDYLLSIECADGGNPATHNRSKQYPVIAEIVAMLAKRHNFAINRTNVIGHREIRASKTCPGNLSVDHIVDLANGTTGSNISKENMKTYKGIDLTNVDSIKVAVSAWKDIVDGKYIKKSEHDSIVEDLDEKKSEYKDENKDLKRDLEGLELEFAQLSLIEPDDSEIEAIQVSLAEKEAEIERLNNSLSGQKGVVTKANNKLAVCELDLAKAVEVKKLDPDTEAVKEAGRWSVAGIAGYILSSLAALVASNIPYLAELGIDTAVIVQYGTLIIAPLIRAIDKKLHQTGKNLENSALKAGLFRF